MLATPADNGRVIGDGFDRLARTPDRTVIPLAVRGGLDAAAEVNVVDHLRPRQLPWIAEAQPLVGIFLLPALRDDLLEQPEIVANAVAECGNAERRHAFHETGGETAEAA